MYYLLPAPIFVQKSPVVTLLVYDTMLLEKVTGHQQLMGSPTYCRVVTMNVKNASIETV